MVINPLSQTFGGNFGGYPGGLHKPNSKTDPGYDGRAVTFMLLFL